VGEQMHLQSGSDERVVHAQVETQRDWQNFKDVLQHFDSQRRQIRVQTRLQVEAESEVEVFHLHLMATAQLLQKYALPAAFFL